MRALAVVAVLLSLPLTRSSAQQPDAAGLLARTAGYLEAYEKSFSVVVSEETYVQELHIEPEVRTQPRTKEATLPKDLTRTLRADVLMTSIGRSEWLAFRDVYEVDGKSVRDRDARLQKLFVETPARAIEQARRIVAESARFNLGRLQRNINIPAMALTYLRGSNQARSDFVFAGRKDFSGVRAAILDFKERSRPTVITSAEGDLPAAGRFWIDPESGRVLKSEISVADRRASAKITVTYGAVPKLTIWVPVLMTGEYTGAENIFAKATYSNLRQFNVAVDQIIK